LAGISRDVKDAPACRQAGSGHGSPANKIIGESEASDASEVLPRWGKTSVPEKSKQDSRKNKYFQ